jgi:hypothetical protein
MPMNLTLSQADSNQRLMLISVVDNTDKSRTPTSVGNADKKSAHSRLNKSVLP